MDTEIFAFIQERYNEIKVDLESDTIFHDPGFEVKNAYHIGHRLDLAKKSMFGQVRVCTHRETGFRRAIKTYSLSSAQESGTDLIFINQPGLKLSMILNEIKIQCQLGHPNICKLHEVYIDPKYIHLILDYCKGGEVYDYLNSKKTFSIEEAFPLFNQLVEAVDYLHNMMIIHRNICIENIMFADKGRTILKIISFGCATQGRRRFSERYGCPMYMPPEMFGESYDNKCDVWSLGVSFYAMIVGHQPFQAKSLSEVIKKIKLGKLPKTLGWKNASKKTKAFIKSLLVKEATRPFVNEIFNLKLFTYYLKTLHELVLFNAIRALPTPNPSDEFIIKVQFANKVKKLLIMLLANKTLLPNLSHLNKVWKEIDDENLGFVTVQRFESYLHKKNSQATSLQQKFFEVFKRFDSSKNNTILHSDFLTALTPINDRGMVIEGFEVLDFDKDGNIQPTDFARECDFNFFEEFEVLFVEVMGKDIMTKEEFINLIIKFSD